MIYLINRIYNNWLWEDDSEVSDVAICLEAATIHLEGTTLGWCIFGGNVTCFGILSLTYLRNIQKKIFQKEHVYKEIWYMV